MNKTFSPFFWCLKPPELRNVKMLLRCLKCEIRIAQLPRDVDIFVLILVELPTAKFFYAVSDVEECWLMFGVAMCVLKRSWIFRDILFTSCLLNKALTIVRWPLFVAFIFSNGGLLTSSPQKWSDAKVGQAWLGCWSEKRGNVSQQGCHFIDLIGSNPEVLSILQLDILWIITNRTKARERVNRS